MSMPLLRATPILVLCAPKSIPTTLIATDGVETGVQFDYEGVHKIKVEGDGAEASEEVRNMLVAYGA